jgi:hypothetical protein
MWIGSFDPFKGAEPSQERQLLFAEPRNFGERFAARQNRQKTQEQDFVERIDHFPDLAGIRHISEISKENRRAYSDIC